MPLTEHQTKELSGLIDRRRNALLAELREDAERARDQPYAEQAGQAPDTGDESVATLIADLEQADVTRDLGEFRGLESARERLKACDYGTCIECGGDIGFDHDVTRRIERGLSVTAAETFPVHHDVRDVQHLEFRQRDFTRKRSQRPAAGLE